MCLLIYELNLYEFFINSRRGASTIYILDKVELRYVTPGYIGHKLIIIQVKDIHKIQIDDQIIVKHSKGILEIPRRYFSANDFERLSNELQNIVVKS